jgi:hypothetical protein
MTKAPTTKKMLLRSLSIALLLVATGSTPVLADGGGPRCLPGGSTPCRAGTALSQAQLSSTNS